MKQQQQHQQQQQQQLSGKFFIFSKLIMNLFIKFDVGVYAYPLDFLIHIFCFSHTILKFSIVLQIDKTVWLWSRTGGSREPCCSPSRDTDVAPFQRRFVSKPTVKFVDFAKEWKPKINYACSIGFVTSRCSVSSSIPVVCKNNIKRVVILFRRARNVLSHVKILCRHATNKIIVVISSRVEILSA